LGEQTEHREQPPPATVANRPPYLRPVDVNTAAEPPAPDAAKPRRKITASKDADQFFEQPKEHSVVKATIIAKYFAAWKNIIKTRTRGGRMAYVDLFAGKGAYDDGTPSTPLLILESIIADPVVREQIVVLFADKKPECIEALRANVAALPGIETMRLAPKVMPQSAAAVGLDKQFETASVVPSFMFLDPFGYEGVTAKLIRAVLKDFGCDVAFFFCFKRMPGAIMNNKVRSHMDALFGRERVEQLRAILPTLKPTEKEAAILSALEASMNSIGGAYVQTFRFRSGAGAVTHHLVFVTKNKTVHGIMKSIMATASSGHVEDVANFEFMSNAPQTLIVAESPIESLMRDLLERFRGRPISIEDIIAEHHYGTPYIEKNYTEALRRLFYDRKAISAVRGPMSPALNALKRSMPVQNTLITFDKA
jgi:three-Cys-motif partner protein